MEGGLKQVIGTLEQACSQNPVILKGAEAQLREWEIQPGFYSMLQTVFSNHTLAAEVRFLASVYFKNGVDRYWRKKAPNGISEQEKEFMKPLLLKNFDEPCNQVASQQALLLSKIARLDYPNNWPELVPQLLDLVHNSTGDIVQHRALQTLYLVIKALASRRLAADRKAYIELMEKMFGFMFELWNRHMAEALHCLEQADVPSRQRSVLLLDRGYLVLKVLRKLAVYGVDDISHSQEVLLFITQIFERINIFLTLQQKIVNLADDVLFRRNNFLILSTKVLLDMLEHHARGFVQFIPSAIEMSLKYNFTEVGEGLMFERLSVNTLNIFLEILRSTEYRTEKTVEDTRSPVALEAHRHKSDLLPPGTLAEIVRRLISHYFLLTDEDLQCWASNPEQYVSEESGDSWKFNLRACTQFLFSTLIKEYRSTLCPVLIELVQLTYGATDPEDLQALRRKDAIYNAVGMASFDLFDDINFDEWFSNKLLPELQLKHPNCRILRRRVIWLIGCWVCVKLSLDLRPTLYSALLPLLDSSEDLVVRLEAANTLRVTVDDIEFRVDEFLPYLEPIFGLLFEMLKEVQECETKMQVLHVMSFVVERVGFEIRPFVSALLHYLPQLWQEATDHNMLKCSILTILISLVQSLGSQCTSLFSFLLPIIQLSTDVTQEPHVYLMEDGIELWLATLQCTPLATPELLDLYHNMPDILEKNTEIFQMSLNVVEAYLLLCPHEFMQRFASSLSSSLTSIVTDLKTKGVNMVLKIIDLVFRLFPQEGPKLFSSFLRLAYVGLVEEEEELASITALYISLISHVFLHNREFLQELLQALATERHCKADDILGRLLDAWLTLMDNVVIQSQKKFATLALASLITTDSIIVRERFGGIINVCVETLHDICDIDGDSKVDSLVREVDPCSDDEFDIEHEKRKRQLAASDVVHRVCLRQVVRNQLQHLEKQLPAAPLQQLLETVDPDVRIQLQTFVDSSKDR